MSYLNDGIDAKDRIQRESYKERKAKETIETHKLRERVQADEQTAINKYSEGFCYRCATKDKILSTLSYVCGDCMEKRGAEGVMCIIVKKHNWEVCDICAEWKFDDVWQLNISYCDSCMKRMLRVHKVYRKKGGRLNAPDEKKKRKIYGKDYREILGDGIMRDQTKDQRYARG